MTSTATTAATAWHLNDQYVLRNGIYRGKLVKLLTSESILEVWFMADF